MTYKKCCETHTHFFDLGGVDIERQNWGGSPAHPKVGGYPLVAEGRAILGTPPQCVFGTFPNSIIFKAEIYERISRH